MILSMTGYGKATAEYQGKKITAEIKSLNSKALDLSTRVAPIYREKEMEVRAMVTQALERGKVEFSLWIEQQEQAEACLINGELVAAYRRQMQEISAKYGIPEPEDYWRAIIRMPDVLSKNDAQPELSEEEWVVARNVVQQAINQLMAFRQQEGEALQQKFQEKLDNIAALLASIEPFEKLRVEKIRQRIIDGLASIPDVEYDKNRLEQEMIYYIEKLDINEEKQRLANHLDYFRKTMEEGHGQGKKLGFIAQEMGREINTTGSKSNLAEMQNIVVKMKDELEQIKEQVLNVL
ncbi:MAG: YicC family protein [Bacteroidaceae bacterium]|nr:YicC family protein [Bacteroidaceae bacterium]